MNKIRLKIKRLLATRWVGFQNSFPMGAGGFRKSETSVRLRLRWFTWHGCCNSEEPGIYFHLTSPACFHFDFLCYPSFSFSFSYSFSLLRWQAGKSSLCIFSVGVNVPLAEQGKGKSRFSTCKWACWVSVGLTLGHRSRGCGSHGALGTQHSPCPLGAWLIPLAAVPWTRSRLSRPLSCKALVFCLVSWWHSIYPRRVLSG